MRSNLFLIVGEDKKLIDFQLFEILSKIEYDENNKIVYDMEVDHFMDVMEEASISSLFSPKKVILVDNFSLDCMDDYALSYLERFINSKVEDVYFIFISKKIDARRSEFKLFKEHFTVIPLDKVDSHTIKDYVVRRIKDRGYHIDSMNVDYFLSKVGNDIYNINQELEKLFIYKMDDRKILREDISLLIFDTIDNVIYEFTNAILEGDIDKVKTMYDKFMLDNVSIDYLIAAISGSFRTSLIIKLLSNKGMNYASIGKVIGKKEFFVKKSLDRLYSYTVEDLGDFINKLARIDREFKSGFDHVGKFELFLFDKGN